MSQTSAAGSKPRATRLETCESLSAHIMPFSIIFSGNYNRAMIRGKVSSPFVRYFAIGQCEYERLTRILVSYYESAANQRWKH
jgi:hypothetical protein